jgi:F0F1-type ATP synthase membrane subunit a
MEVIYGHKIIEPKFHARLTYVEPTRWQRFRWFVSRNWYVPICMAVAVFVGMHAPGLLAIGVASFVTSFLLVTLFGRLLK